MAFSVLVFGLNVPVPPLRPNEMDLLGCTTTLEFRLERNLEQRGKLPILLAEIFTLKRHPTNEIDGAFPDSLYKARHH